MSNRLPDQILTPNVSVIITTFNEGDYLDRILEDVAAQELGGIRIEVLVLEAGNYLEVRAQQCLGKMSSHLRFFSVPGLSRTTSLNFLVEKAKGELVVRLDARSHIAPDYIKRICDLSKSTGATNVGGRQVPIGTTPEQKVIARVMQHPFSLGGAKFRRASYVGPADSVYLGAFRKERIKFPKWFDDLHPKISEDSDLNFRIRKAGGTIAIDSNIHVEHFPRETLKKFFRLCFNYGIGRGLFILKHRSFSASRQLIPPVTLIVALLLFATGFIRPELHILLAIGAATYGMFVLTASVSTSSSRREISFAMLAFVGCHFFWMIGMICSPYVYFSDLRDLGD